MLHATKSAVVPMLGLLLIGAISAPAAADDECDVGKTCPSPTYKVLYPPKTNQCPPDTPIAVGCREPTEPPSPASLNCEYNYGGYLCEAWPQGNTIRYAYNGSGAISLPYSVPNYSPFANVACWRSGSGSLRVTITSTSAPGQSSVVTRSLYCP